MYEIKVLSNEEFDNLGHEETRGSDIHDSLGFANKHTGRAYVRQTGHHDLNKYLISHELEELESDESTHEDENGIRHKKGPKLFKDILLPSLLGFATGGGGGAALGAAGGFLNSQNKQQQQPTEPMSYAPTTGMNAYGASGSPLNLFGGQGPETSGSYAPGPGSISFAQSQGGELPPELLQRLKSGNYSGRLTF